MRRYKNIIKLLLGVSLISSLLVTTNLNVSKNIKEETPLIAETVISVGTFAEYLRNQKEHYPFSDEFIERYQQKSGGYIDNAKKAGLVVDKQLHLPDQKWHFFDSWYEPSIVDGSLSDSESAKSRIYTKLLCPELLLWIYEASNVTPNKIKEAKKVAESGKRNGTSVSTIAKNMRACVSWEDICLSALGITL